jgi:L-malate glycosyltransferase
MKVLEVISALNPIGGSETFAVNFCSVMTHECNLKVVILRNQLNPILLKRLQDSGADYCVLNKKRHFDPKTIRELKAIISKFRPDVIHTENNALLTAFLSSKHIPIFHTVHLLAQYEHGSSKTIDCCYRFIFKSSRVHPVGISPEVTASICNYYRLKKDIPTIENGINLDRFQKKTSLSQRHYAVAMVARFEEVKNHEFAFDLFKSVHQLCPNSQFALAGNGELFAHYKELAENEKMDYVHFLGLIEDVPGLLNDSKVLMLCSHHEANPLSLLEGMACGCVIVAAKVGGIPDIVSDNKNGYLFDLSQPDRFVSQIGSIVTSPASYENLSAYNAVSSSQHGLETMSQKYLSLFRSLTKSDHQG